MYYSGHKTYSEHCLRNQLNYSLYNRSLYATRFHFFCSPTYSQFWFNVV